MDKVYIVTAGDYSAYHIVAVFDDKTKADEFCGAYNGRVDLDFYKARVEEHPIGMNIEYAGMDVYCAERKETGEIYTYDICEYIRDCTEKIGTVSMDGKYLKCYIAVPKNADDQYEYALKVSADMFAEYLAKENGIA